MVVIRKNTGNKLYFCYLIVIRMKIGILSSGGDCPGINATIRGVGKTAIMHYNMEVVGIHSGFSGILRNDIQTLNERSLSGILNLGGTILGTSREKSFRKLIDLEDDRSSVIKQQCEELGLDCIVCIGGNGTQKTSNLLSEIGLNIIGIPKTIDNDVWGTDITFGFDTAVNIATDAIDRLHSTANAHRRVMVVEVMGHHAGWIALYAGMAGGADVILLPELGYDIDKVNEVIIERAHRGKPYSIVVVAEGIETPGHKLRPADYIMKKIEEATEIETRETVLGYIQRGGNPSPFDRNLATRLGGHAAELIANHQYGRMVCMKGDQVDSLPLSEVAGKLKLVPPRHDLIIQGERMGISFGK
jgi:6-phosphofructokinase 1